MKKMFYFPIHLLLFIYLISPSSLLANSCPGQIEFQALLYMDKQQLTDEYCKVNLVLLRNAKFLSAEESNACGIYVRNIENIFRKDFKTNKKDIDCSEIVGLIKEQERKEKDRELALKKKEEESKRLLAEKKKNEKIRLANEFEKKKILDAFPINIPRPVYPRRAQERGQMATVTVELFLAQDGTHTNHKVISSNLLSECWEYTSDQEECIYNSGNKKFKVRDREASDFHSSAIRAAKSLEFKANSNRESDYRITHTFTYYLDF
tara:strand:- start:389 stop:1180 length:792 start_codon:yes stop_codon:yes gene_type:complete